MKGLILGLLLAIPTLASAGLERYPLETWECIGYAKGVIDANKRGVCRAGCRWTFHMYKGGLSIRPQYLKGGKVWRNLRQYCGIGPFECTAPYEWVEGEQGQDLCKLPGPDDVCE